MNGKVISVIILVLLLVGGWYFFLREGELVGPEAPVQNIPESEILNWETYENTKFGFEFRYPSNWGIVKVDTPSPVPPYVFNITLQTEEHPVRRSGNISVVAVPFDTILDLTKKNSSTKNMKDFSSVDFAGKKYKTVYTKDPNSPQQTDYNYILSMDDSTILIFFASFECTSSEPCADSIGEISPGLLSEIEAFAGTFARVR